MKQVIVVRTDLKMGKGKIAGQVAHASVRAYRESGFWAKRKWFKKGEVKIVLKVKSREELAKVVEKCILERVKPVGVRDAGRTQIEPGTLTAVAFGPVEDEVADKITGDLKLL